jgi:hypothetical protein
MRRTIWALIATIASGTAWAASSPTFYKDAKTGCQVGTFAPEPGTAVSWKGPCVNGKAQGRGIAEWTVNGAFSARSEGEFRAGLREGRILTTDKDHNLVEWEFHGGLGNGRGITLFADGGKFDGQIRNNNANGHGKRLLANGDRYEGDFRDGTFNGHGVYVWKDGEIYDGNFVNGLREGRGRQVAPNGAWYQGQWARGKFNGDGAEVFSDGGWYQGHWADGMADGMGQYVGGALNGTTNVWAGQWRQGCLSTPDGMTAAVGKSRADCGF